MPIDANSTALAIASRTKRVPGSPGWPPKSTSARACSAHWTLPVGPTVVHFAEARWYNTRGDAWLAQALWLR